MCADLAHTADVQVHAQGESLAIAFEQTALGMCNYICRLEQVEERSTRQFTVEADDQSQLLLRFLEEVLELCMLPPYFLTRRLEVVLAAEATRLTATW